MKTNKIDLINLLETSKLQVDAIVHGVAICITIIAFGISFYAAYVMRASLLPELFLTQQVYGYMPILITPVHIGYLIMFSMASIIAGGIYLITTHTMTPQNLDKEI